MYTYILSRCLPGLAWATSGFSVTQVIAGLPARTRGLGFQRCLMFPHDCADTSPSATRRIPRHSLYSGIGRGGWTVTGGVGGGGCERSMFLGRAERLKSSSLHRSRAL